VLRYTESEGAITFPVRVVARASRSEVAGAHDGALRVRVAAPPVGGAANEELIRTLARALKVPARSVEIVGGHHSKSKQVRAAGVGAQQLLALAAG
jgi:uncharacterized protein